MIERLHPRQNSDLEGHGIAENQLINAWTTGRLHHAWLISGRKGIGKATLAYRFARFLLTHGNPASEKDTGPSLFCDDENLKMLPSSLDINPDSTIARRIAANGHADLQVIECGISDDGQRVQNVISVEKIRSIGHTMSLTAGEGGWRVIIVDAAEDMNRNAANALLKILEEPPRRSIILLISHAPSRLLPTIRSRCRQLKLNELKPEVIIVLLKKWLPELSQTELHSLAGLSDGSIGHALDLADSGGIALKRDLLQIMEDFPAFDMAMAHQFANRFTRRDSDAAWRTAVEIASRGLADIVISSARKNGLADRGYLTEEAAALSRLSKLAPAQKWIEAWETNNALFARTESINLDKKQVMLNALTTMANVARTSV